MRRVEIKKNGKKLDIDCDEAHKFFERFLGLMGKQEIKKGLVITKCKSIHTCFMKVSMDAVFLNTKNEVVKMLEKMKPWRFSGYYFKASKVLELPAGSIKRFNIKRGDQLDIHYV